MASNSENGISPATQANAAEEPQGNETSAICLQELIPEGLRNFQKDSQRGLEMISRRFSNLDKNHLNRPKVDILSELAKEGYATLYEQMDRAISERDDIQEKVVQKSNQLNVGKFEATYEVYVDLIVRRCSNSVDKALLWVIDEQQQFREFCTEVFVIRLLDRGANVRYCESESGLKTPLHLAAKRGFSDVAKILIERDLLERGSSNATPAGGIVYCTARDDGQMDERTPLEIAIRKAIELAKDTSNYKTFKRQLGLVKDKKECQDYCNFAVLMIKNMECERVRKLFQAEHGGRLSLHSLLEHGCLTDLALAVLDTMCEPKQGDKKYTVHYSILEADENGYPPDHVEFKSPHKSCLSFPNSCLSSPNSCLYKIARSQNKKIVYHVVVRLLLRRKWRSFARIIFWLQFFWYLLVFMLLTTALVLAAKKADPRVYTSPVDYFRFFCEVLLILVVIIYNGFAELRQMLVHKCYYLLDRFNYIDVPAVLFTLLVIPFRVTGHKIQWIFAALSYLFNGLRAFKYASVNQLTGAYVQIIFRILVRDIIRFGVVSLAFFLSFSGTFYFALRSEYDHPHTTSFKNDSDIAEIGNISITEDVDDQRSSTDILFEKGEIYDVWLIGFRVVIEGTGVIRGYFQQSSLEWFGMIIYLSFIFVIIVLLLNLLVAQMSNTYNKILNEAQYALLLNRAWIVARAEHNSLFGLMLLYLDKLRTKGCGAVTVQGNCKPYSKGYLQMRLYVPYEVLDPQEELEKWDVPLFDVIHQKVDALELEQRKQFNAIVDMRKGLMEKMTEIQRSITA